MKFKIHYLSIILIGFVLLSSCSKKGFNVAQQDSQYYKFNKNKPTVQDKSVEDIISPYREIMKSEMDEIIIHSTVELTRAKPNSTMGNWISDLILEEAQTYSKDTLDCSFQNYGGIRINSLPKGAVTKGKIYEVMPFENMTVILHTKGAILRRLCDRIVAYGGWPISKGLSFKMGSNNKAENIVVRGKPLEDDKTYHIVIADYIANGGDSCDFLKDVERTETGVLIRELIIKNLREKHQQGKKITTQYEERIIPKNK